MSAEYTITSELIYEPPERWIAVKNVKTYTEDGTEVNREVILTGEMAIGCRVDGILKRYAAFKEQQKQERIALARRLLGMEA